MIENKLYRMFERENLQTRFNGYYIFGEWFYFLHKSSINNYDAENSEIKQFQDTLPDIHEKIKTFQAKIMEKAERIETFKKNI